MKLVIFGGSGLIGSKLISKLREAGHDAVSASPKSGVNTLTGEGLAKILEGAQVAVDVTNSPSFEDAAVLKFFETSTPNMLRAEAAAGVKHHVALSVVGAERLPDSGYMRAKVAQEAIIKKSTVPYTIVRATQFFEFLGAIAGSAADGGTVRLTTAKFQPMAAEDVAAALADVAVKPPVNGMIEIGGPEAAPMSEIVQRYMKATNDSRPVVADPQALYFGAKINDASLTADGQARLGPTHLESWLSRLNKTTA